MNSTYIGVGLLGRIWIWLKKYGPFLILYISSAILILWPFLDATFSSFLKTSTLIGIAVGCLTLLISDFYSILERLHGSLKQISLEEKSTRIEHQSINEAIRNAVLRFGSDQIKEVRILASTTEVILPAIRECKHKIDNCTIYIQYFDPNSDDKKIKLLSRKTAGFIETWFDLVDQGMLKSISIYQTPSTPTFYTIIFESSLIIFGLYVPAPLKAHAVDFDEPVIIDGETNSGKKLITKFCKQYDYLCSLATKVQPPG